MTTWPILSVVTFLPTFGALLVYISRGDDEAARRNSRWIALWSTLITFAVSLILVWRFDPAQPDFQFVEKANWLASGITYHMGVDGISLPFVILTTALMPFCIVASWKSITMRVREYMMAFLLLETLMIGTFSALDASKRQTRISETAKVTSVVHSAIQRALRRAASSSPRVR